MFNKTILSVSALGCILVLGGIALFTQWSPQAITIQKEPKTNGSPTTIATTEEKPAPEITEKIDYKNVRSFYTPAWVFADTAKRAALIKTAQDSGANALVIDVKDTTGVIMPPELGAWVQEVRDAGLIAIARVVVFQDNEFAQAHHDAALQNADGSLWIHKGLYWLDPAAPNATDHVIEVSKKAIDLGFEEINLDYIRFPTDGNVDAIVFPVYKKDTPRAPIIAEALSRIRTALKEYNPNIILSADLYAFSFIVKGDVGIGQQITVLGPHLDVIAPMIYPSHYGAGNFGFSNPAAHPYEVTDGTLESGIAMLNTLPEEQRPFVRPWIQAFNMGAEYTPALIQESRQAVFDNTNHDSWMAWNATARYEPAGYALPLKKSTITTSTTQ